MEAGTDNTRSSLNYFVAGSALYLDWIERTRKQLDEVYGDAERLPDREVWPQLPLIPAAANEIVCWSKA